MAKMNMNTYDKIKEMMDKKRPISNLNNRGNYVKIGEEKLQYRFMPMSDGLPFKPVFVHYMLQGKRILCRALNNDLLGFRDSCPICEFRWALYNKFKDVLKGRPIKEISPEEKAASVELRGALEDLQLSKDISAKASIYTNVIIRGREDEGVKILNLTNATFEKILTLISESIENEEEKDITDILKGSDFKIFKNSSDKKSLPTIDVLRIGSKPLTTDKKLLEILLSQVIEKPSELDNVPTKAQLEAAIVERFNLSEADIEVLSTERIVGGITDKALEGDEEQDQLAKLIQEMN